MYAITLRTYIQVHRVELPACVRGGCDKVPDVDFRAVIRKQTKMKLNPGPKIPSPRSLPALRASARCSKCLHVVCNTHDTSTADDDDGETRLEPGTRFYWILYVDLQEDLGGHRGTSTSCFFRQ